MTGVDSWACIHQRTTMQGNAFHALTVCRRHCPGDKAHFNDALPWWRALARQAERCNSQATDEIDGDPRRSSRLIGGGRSTSVLYSQTPRAVEMNSTHRFHWSYVVTTKTDFYHLVTDQTALSRATILTTVGRCSRLTNW